MCSPARESRDRPETGEKSRLSRGGLLGTLPSTTRFMFDLALATLEHNWRDGYTVPSPRLYPFQWNWDAGFIALGHAATHPERAIAEIRSVFRAQWRNGMLPHIAFHRPDPNYFPGPEVWRTDR